jgi:hypothetical protein
MKEIEVWLEEKILGFLRSRQGRIQEMTLQIALNPDRRHNLNWDMLKDERPEWALIAEQKRQSRIHKVLQRMAREHKIRIVDESGDPTFSESYTRYVYEVNLLDRIAAHLED